jgi:FkbM family methyltransferase
MECLERMRGLDVIGVIRRGAYQLRHDRSRQFCRRLGLGHGYICLDGSSYFQCPANPVAYSVFQDMAFSGEGRRERDEFLALSAGCRSFVDVGASGGFFSVLFAASRRDAATVLSIEPDPGAREVLQDLRNKNPRPGVRWEIEPTAVMTATPTALFVSSGYGAEVVSPTAIRNAQKCAAENNLHSSILEVQCATLPDLLSRHAVLPDLLKIDIESWEHELVESSLDALRAWKPKIMLELHVALLGRRGKDPRLLLQSLASIGYRRFRGLRRSPSSLMSEVDAAGVVRAGLII